MPDDQAAAGNIFDGIDPQMSEPQAPPPAPNIFDEFPDVETPKVSGLSSFFGHAARGLLPTAGGMAAAAAGAEGGGALGALAGPGGALVGGVVGGLAGFFGGSEVAGGAQDWALHQAPDSWQEAIGQSDRQQRLQEQQHPIYSFLGGVAPYALTMRPGGFTTKALNLPADATTFQRIMANPITGRLFGGAAMGGMELGQEELQGESPNWAKIGISTGFGLVFNKPTGFGEYLTGAGAGMAGNVRGAAFGAYMLRSPLAVPPEGVLHPMEPTVAQAGDLGVIGPGITESTYRGGTEQSEATRTTAENAASDEQSALGALPQPDLVGIARRVDPEAFQQNDELLARRDALREFIATESNPPQEAVDALATQRTELETQLAAEKNRTEQRRLRAQIRDVASQADDLNRRREAWATGNPVDAPGIMLARQHLLDTEHALWDVGPQVSAAMRRAADHVGQPEELPSLAAAAPPPETPASAHAPEAPAEAQAPVAAPGGLSAPGTLAGTPPPRPIEAQKADIVADRTAQLVAAGMSREHAEASAHVEAAYYETLAQQFRGALGSAEDLYRQHAAQVVGPAGARSGPSVAPRPGPAPAASAAPAAPAAPPSPAPRPRVRRMEDIAREEGINPVGRAAAAKIKTIQDAEMIALGDWQAAQRAAAPPPVAQPRAQPPAAPGIAVGAPEPAAVPRSAGPAPAEPARLAPVTAPSTPRQPRQLGLLTPEGRPPERLSSFIKRLGGVRDLGGDVRHSGGGALDRPGLINRRGRTLDDAAIAAGEAGYFPELGDERPAINDLLDKLHEELHGTPQYSTHDAVALARYQEAVGRNEEIVRLAGEHAIDITGMTPEGFAEALAAKMTDVQREAEVERQSAALVAAEQRWRASLDHLVAEHNAVEEAANEAGNDSIERIEDDFQQDIGAARMGAGEVGGREPGRAGGHEGPGEEGAGPRGGGAGAGRGGEEGAAGASRDEGESGEIGRELDQTTQGKITLGSGRPIITLMANADASTFLHESSHHWLEQLLGFSEHPQATPAMKSDAEAVRNWLRAKNNDDITYRGKNRQLLSAATKRHEKFARGFEQYLREGVAPSPALASVFAKFKEWLTKIYTTLKGLGAPISDDIRGVFDRMLSAEPRRTVYAESGERNPTLASTHEIDATEAEPHAADAAADRVSAERNDFVAGQNPEVANELAEAGPAAAGPAATGQAAEPAGEAGGGAGGGGSLDADRGQSEPVPPGGVGGANRSEVGAGGGASAAEGAGVSRGADERRGAGANPGNELAPKPADTILAGDSRDVDLAGNIRVENLTDVEGIAQAIHDSADRNDEFRAVRGSMTKGQMLDLAEAMGLDPAKISETQLARLLGGTQDLGAKILAARRLVVQSAGIVSDLMRVAASGSDKEVAALGVAIARHDMIQSALSGVTAEWGRAGNAFHSLLDGWENAQDVNQLLKDNLGRDLFQIKMIAKLGARLDTPAKVSKFLNDARKRSFGGMVLEYWINGLISGFSTHVTYMVGNSLLAAEKAGPETAAAWAIGALRAGGGRAGERVRLGEVGAQFRGAFHELPAAAQAALEAYRSGQTTLLPGETAQAAMPFQGETNLALGRNMTNAPVTWAEVKGDAYSLIQGMRDGVLASADLVRAGGVQGAPLLGWQYSPLGQIPDLAFRGVNVLPLGTLARLPSRNVAAIHSTFRAMNYSMEINALAYRQAAGEGLAGTTLAARVADLRQKPTEDMMARAREKATDLTLMGQGGAFTQALSRLTNVEIGGFKPLKFVDPFVNIAANIMDQALVQRTPAGLLSSEVRADLLGKNGNVAQDTAMAKMLVGSAVAVTFGGLAAQGLMSGSGPSDPHKAAMWRLAGNQAHSIRVGDIWYDVHRLGPMGMLASVAADMYDVAHSIGKDDADVVGKSLMHAFSQNILDESFMRGPSDLVKAVTDPDRYGAGYVRNFLSSFVPYSVAMAQLARASDPYSRQARTIMDAIKAKTPGLSDTLFPRRDIWGEMMPSGDALIAPGVTAIYARRMSSDPVNLAMLSLGIAPAPVERSIRNVPLTDQQFDDFARIAGRGTKLRLDAIVRSPDYQMWPNATRHEVIEEVIRQSREAARGMVMMKYPTIPRASAQRQIARKTGEPLPIE